MSDSRRYYTLRISSLGRTLVLCSCDLADSQGRCVSFCHPKQKYHINPRTCCFGPSLIGQNMFWLVKNSDPLSTVMIELKCKGKATQTLSKDYFISRRYTRNRMAAYNSRMWLLPRSPSSSKTIPNQSVSTCKCSLLWNSELKNELWTVYERPLTNVRSKCASAQLNLVVH